MTALQDWLSSAVNPRTVKSLVWDMLRGALPEGRTKTGDDLPLLARGLERC